MNFKQDYSSFTGNDRFEGFIVDLLNKLASSLKFTHTLKLVEDDSYGGFNPVTNEWTGMVGELVSKVRVKIIYFNVKQLPECNVICLIVCVLLN